MLWALKSSLRSGERFLASIDVDDINWFFLHLALLSLGALIVVLIVSLVVSLVSIMPVPREEKSFAVIFVWAVCLLILLVYLAAVIVDSVLSRT